MRFFARIILIVFMFLCSAEVVFAYEPNDYLNKETKYYYNEMTDEEKAIYDNILSGVVNFEERISIKCTSERQLYEVLMKFRADFPEIFWLAESYKYGSNDNNEIICVYLGYVYTKDGIDEINKIIKETIDKLKDRTKDMTELEKAREIFDFTCEKIKYNKETFNPINVDQAFINGDAICGGYAKMYCILANGVGLKCKMAVGCRILEADVGHSWNEIYIGDDVIYVDCTWGDSSQKRGKENSYFNTEEEEFLEKHNETII